MQACKTEAGILLPGRGRTNRSTVDTIQAQLVNSPPCPACPPCLSLTMARVDRRHRGPKECGRARQISTKKNAQAGESDWAVLVATSRKICAHQSWCLGNHCRLPTGTGNLGELSAGGYWSCIWGLVDERVSSRRCKKPQHVDKCTCERKVTEMYCVCICLFIIQKEKERAPCP